MKPLQAALLLCLSLTCAVEGGCGLLAAAAADPDLQTFVLKKIFGEISDTMNQTDIPFTIEYDHGHGEHLWLVTVKDSDLPQAK